MTTTLMTSLQAAWSSSRVALVSNIVSLLGIAWIIAWYGFLEPPWLSYPTLPFAVEREPHAGEAVLLKVTRCNSDAEPRIYAIAHTLIRDGDGHRFVLPPGVVSIEPGCTTETSAANVVPPSTEPGIYHVEGAAEVQGHIRTIAVPWRSAPFRVLPKE